MPTTERRLGFVYACAVGRGKIRGTAGRSKGSIAGSGSSNLIGLADKLPLRDAVLMNGALVHGLDYGLFDKTRLQQHWLGICAAAGMVWHRGEAIAIRHSHGDSLVTTACGQHHRARLVVDATGHQPVFVERPDEGPVAGQAAYGIVGRFSAPPVDPGQFVLMDYRCDHLSEAERRCGPPTFLYAMDLGDGVFFVEETSLALAPAVPYDVLKDRLLRRLRHRGVTVEAVQHEEHCLFPMNLPLPDLQQRLLAFGGAAAMVHPHIVPSLTGAGGTPGDGGGAS